MTEQSSGASNKTGRAAAMIDSNFEKVAAMIDRIRLNIIEQSDENNKPVPFVGGLSDQLGSASERLRAIQGADVVEYAKTQIDRHPAMLTVAVAAMGAAAAQIAVAAVRNVRCADAMANETVTYEQ